MHRVADARLPTDFGQWRIVGYKNDVDKTREALRGSAEYGYIELPKANQPGKDSLPQLRASMTTFDAPAKVDPESEKRVKNEPQDSRSLTRNCFF